MHLKHYGYMWAEVANFESQEGFAWGAGRFYEQRSPVAKLVK